MILLIPLLILASLPAILWPSNPLDISGREMFSTGLLTAALALFAFEMLMVRISTLFGTLWRRGSIAEAPKPGEDPTTATNRQAISSYRQFMQDIEDELNSRYQWVTAVIFGLLVFTWYPLHQPAGNYEYLIGLGVEIVIAFFIGLVVWRMVSIGWHIWHLPKKHELEVQVLHPDQCGGLEPLGNLCLWNALITAVAGIYLGGWISIGPTTPFASYAFKYGTIFRILLIVPILLSFLTFIWPLWTTHQAMAKKKAEIQIRLDDLAKSIYAESTVLLNQTYHQDVTEGDERNRRLNLMREIYTQHQKIPTWPINTSILTKFAVAQAVPVLSYIGVGGPIASVLSALLKLVPQAGQ